MLTSKGQRMIGIGLLALIAYLIWQIDISLKKVRVATVEDAENGTGHELESEPRTKTNLHFVSQAG